MGRKVTSVVWFAVVAAGCGTAPAPAPEFAPAPMVETAEMIEPAESADMAAMDEAMPADEVAAMAQPMPMGEMGTPVEPGNTRSGEQPPVTNEPAPSPEASGNAALEYARSDDIVLEWVGDKGARITASFCVSFSAPMGRSDLAAETMNANWQDAVEMARAICEHADLFDEHGRTAAETLLCRKLTEVMFANADGDANGQVERVIWNRLLWR